MNKKLSIKENQNDKTFYRVSWGKGWNRGSRDFHSVSEVRDFLNTYIFDTMGKVNVQLITDETDKFKSYIVRGDTFASPDHRIVRVTRKGFEELNTRGYTTYDNLYDNANNTEE